MKRSAKVIFLFLSAIVSFHCGVTQPVRVIEEGTTKAALSLGGPLISFKGLTIPTPYLNAGLLYGYSPEMTLTSNLHLTMAVLKNVGLDAGVAERIVEQKNWRPEVTLKAQLYLFSDLKFLKSTRLLPLFSANVSYLFGESMLLYGGTEQLFQFSDPAYFLTPFIGTQFNLSERWSMQVEVKWMAANMNTARGIFEGHSSLGGHGAVGTFIGFQHAL